MNVFFKSDHKLTQLHHRVNGSHTTQQTWELVLLYVINPFIYCIGEELINTQ